MTEAPSVISPTGPPRPSTGTNSTATATPEGDDINNGEICCICDVSDDDGLTICCDKCNTWQHFICVGIAKQEVPKYYLCPKCDPRELDVEKARDHQRARRERERHKVKVPPPAKKKSHRRKESNTVAHTNTFITPTLPHPSLEPRQAVARNPSPSHSTTNTTSHKKRTNRSTGPTTQDGGRSGRTSPTHSKRGEDSDTDVEKAPKSYKLEFDDLGDKPDVYMGKDVSDFVEKVTHQRDSSSQPLRYYAKDQFTSLHFPRISVRQLISPKGNANPRWRYRLVTENVCEKGSLVALYKGEVGFKDSYKDSNYNQYSLIQHPKQFVLFHPNLPLYVDARKHGVDCRFARISCKPTLSLQTVVVEGGLVALGLFATANMKSGSELTVPWFWEASESASRIMSLKDTDPTAIPAEDLFNAGDWASKVLSHFGECACGGGENSCILRKLNLNRPSNQRPHLPNGTKKRSKASGDHMRVPHSTLHATPDCDEFRAPRSRSHNLEDALTPHDNGEMSKREAQKVKQYAAQFERMEQTEGLQPNIKRRKRTNAVTPLGGDAKDDSSESSKKPKTALESPKSTATVSSPHQTSNKRHCSESGSVRSEASSPSSAVKRKRPVYVDAAIQTDDDDNVPVWLKSSGPASPPLTAPPLSLKKRLMLCLSVDKQGTPAPEERKRKRTGSESEGSPSKSPKEPKLTEGVSMPQITESTPEEDQDIKMEDNALVPTIETDATVVPKIEPSQTASPLASKSSTPVVEPATHPSPTTSPPSTGATPQPPVEKKESPTPALELTTSPSTSGKRPGLNLELPPPTVFSNGAPGSAAASTTTPASAQSSQTATLPTPFSPSLTDSGVQPNPRKKVISFGEYARRQKRVDGDKAAPKRKEANDGESGKENKEAASAVAV